MEDRDVLIESYLQFRLFQLRQLLVAPQFHRLRRLVLGVAVVLIVIGGILAGRIWWTRAKYMRMRADGLAAAQSGRPEVAADLLGRYLTRYPIDRDALLAYSRVRPAPRDRASLDESTRLLQHLLVLDPSLIEQRRALMRMYAENGALGSASVEAARILLTREDPEALHIRLTDLVRRRQLPEALEVERRWRAVAPLDLNLERAILSLMRRDHAIPTEQITEQIVDRCNAELAAHPNDPASWVLAVHGYAISNNANPQKQAELLANAVKQFQTGAACTRDVAIAVALSEELDRHGRQADALDVLKTSAAVTRDRSVSFVLGQRLWMCGRVAEADAAFGDPTPGEPPDALALDEICSTLLNKVDKVKAIDVQLSSRRGAAADAWRDIVAWEVGSPAQPSPSGPVRNTDSDRRLITAIHSARKETPATDGVSAIWWYYEAEAEAGMGEMDLAIASWEHSGERACQWATPLKHLVPALMQAGRWQAAVTAARAAVQRDPRNLGAAIAFVQAWSAALHACPDLAERPSDSRQPASTMTADRLLALLDVILKQAPGNETAICLRVQLLAAQASTRPSAVTAIDQVIAARPLLSPRSYVELATISRSAGLGKEKQCLDVAGQLRGNSPQIALARAMFGLERWSGPKAGGPADSAEWQAAHARFLEGANDPGALAAIATLADAHPDDLNAQRDALQSRAAWGDRDLMCRVIDRTRRLTGEDGLQWRLAKARLLISQSPPDFSAAQDLVNFVLSAAPNSVEGHTHLAEVFEAKSDWLAAAKEWAVISQLIPDSLMGATGQARALWRQGRSGEAKQALAQLAAHPPQSRGDRALLVRALADCDEADRAIAIAEELNRTATATEEADGRLLLANLYGRKGRLAEARDTLKPLTERADPVPAALFQLAGLATQERDANASAAAYRRLLALTSGQNLSDLKPLAANNLCCLLLSLPTASQTLAEELSLAQQAVGAKPEVAAFHETLAAVYRAQNNDAMSENELDRTVKLAPLLRYRARLAEALAHDGKVDAARQLAWQVEADVNGPAAGDPGFSESDRRELAALFSRLNAPPQTLEQQGVRK